ncbi:unnamed protein product [Oikopleura dioica]|uniref:Selenoprotein F/M domain-containing protein n=1 Tax=Oikopleura dioica TaxID=34765 RepID=E4Y7P1_OIKDI|nr:unnamed protein product [Oikopleura dioica]
MRPILIGTILQLVAPSDQEGSDCTSLGFDQQVLECNTCKELSDFGLESIKKECLSCCKKSDEQIVTYKSAKFEVCS